MSRPSSCPGRGRFDPCTLGGRFLWHDQNCKSLQSITTTCQFNCLRRAFTRVIESTRSWPSPKRWASDGAGFRGASGGRVVAGLMLGGAPGHRVGAQAAPRQRQAHQLLRLTGSAFASKPSPPEGTVS